MSLIDELFFGKTRDDYYWEGYNDAKEGNTSAFNEIVQSAFSFVGESEEQRAYNAGVRDGRDE
jgi:hypothetical protein